MTSLERIVEDSEVIIRQAAAEDIESVIDLAVEMVVYSISPHRPMEVEEVRRYRRDDLQALHGALDAPHAGIFIAEDSQGRFLGHVVVMAGQSDSSTGEKQGWIFDLSVLPELWGKGVGRKLMVAAERFVRTKGLNAVGLAVTRSNGRALSFYERLGYQQERVQMVKRLDRQEDEEGWKGGLDLLA